jgi:acetyl esterase
MPEFKRGLPMTEPFVRPDVRTFLDQMAAAPRPPFSDELIAMMRQIPPGSFPSMDLPVGELGEIRDVTMPGPAGDIALRLFDPRAKRAPGPVVVFYHGGGFVVGSVDTHGALAAEIARGLDLPVVFVEYRLAPEHRWPAAPDDAEAAARWIAENGAAFGREFTGMLLCGDSAGGNLTAITSMALRDEPAALPVIMQFAIYPLTDATQDYESRRLFSNGYGLDAHDMAYFNKAYDADVSDWRKSPALRDLTGMPPSVVVTAGLDPLRDDGRAYAAKLKAAGVPVTYREYEGTVHGFATYRLLIPSAREDLADMLEAVNDVLREAVA